MEDELARALAASERTHALEESRRNSAEEAALKEALALSLNDAAPQERVSRAAALRDYALGEADLFFIRAASDGSLAVGDVARAAARKHGSAEAARAEARRRGDKRGPAAAAVPSSSSKRDKRGPAAAAVPSSSSKRSRVDDETVLADRTREVASGQSGGGDYVLCVLQLALRAACNPALITAGRAARDGGGRRLVVAVVLHCRTARHGAFELECLADLAAGLEGRAHECVAVLGDDRDRLRALAGGAASVVCDDCAVEPFRSVVAGLAASGRRVSAVDSACLVPFRCGDAGRACARAYAFRSATAKRRTAALATACASLEALDRDLAIDEPCVFDATTAALLAGDDAAVDEVLDSVPCCDRRVPRVASMRGGEEWARRRWAAYKARGLKSYPKRRNDATSVDAVSRLSAHLHYGAANVFAIARDAKEARADKFLDELLVFREMGFAFAAKHEAAIAADAFATLPAWARKTLADHGGDPRPRALTLDRLESAATGDAVWDAMQRSLIRHGELHNNLRMTWGKAFIPWAATPRDAFEWAMALNDRYALDGSDPNSYAGVAWCFGAFDGPKKPPTTKVTGSLRARPTSTHARIRDRYVALVDGAYPPPAVVAKIGTTVAL